MKRTPFREPVRLLFHLNGVSRVVFERLEGNGMAGGGGWEIPTEIIPAGLRAIGIRFLVEGQFVWPEAGDTATELREAVRAMRVVSLEGSG